MTLPDAAVTHRRPSPAALAVAVVSLAVFMVSLDLFIVNLAFPYIGRDFGSSLDGLSWVLNGYTIVFAATLVPAGRYADRVGRRRVFAAGLLVFTIGSALCGIAPGVATLVAARVVQAVGGGLMVPASLSLLLSVVPARDRARAIGTWSAIAALGAGMGPVIGGLLVQLDWRWVFWVNLPVGVVTLLLTRRALPESSDPEAHRRPDVLGAVGIALAIGAIALALVKAPDWGWLSWSTDGLIVAAAAVLLAVLRHSANHPAPVVDIGLLRVRSFSGAFVASVVYYGGFGAFVLNSVEFLTGEWHYSAIRAGLAIAPGPLCVLPFARLVAPRLAPVLGGPGRVAVLGCLVNAGAQLLWLASMTSSPSYAAHLLPAQLIGGMGVGLTIPSLLGAGTSAVPPAWFGTASGVLNMGRQVGSVLGVAGLIGVLTTTHAATLATYQHGVVLVAAFFLGAAVVAGALLTRRPQPVVQPMPAQPDALAVDTSAA
jgi:EmrB/QacA subfamily drug resistance transporter